jgi:tRNA (guanine-N7-)-methyltransferase
MDRIMSLKSEFAELCGNSGSCVLAKKCLHIPSRFSEQKMTAVSWDDPNIFDRPQPLHVEFCSGNGQWIASMAQLYPRINWIAVEKDFERARKIWLKIFRLQLGNLFVVYGEGFVFSRYFLPDTCVGEVYVNFPDPWPKRRHAKHRIIQKSFIDEMSRILISDGTVTLVTDDAAYSEQMIELFSSWPSAWGSSPYVTEWPEFGDSFFQSLWARQHRTIRYHRFIMNRGRGI